MKSGIGSVAYVLPARRTTTGELAEKFGFEPDFVSKKLGISARHFANETETASVLGARAALAALDKAKIAAGEIDFLLLVTQNPDFRLPHSSALVHAKLGMRADAGAMDISLGCSGFVYALATAHGLIAGGLSKRVLVVTSDQYSRIVDPSDRGTAPLFGDAAAAAIIHADAPNKFLAFDFGTDGSRHEALIVRDGTLHMNGRAIYEFAVRTVPGSVERCIAKAGLALGEIDYFIFHQGSRYMVESLADRMGLPREKVVIDIDGYGNTVSSTLPICLANLAAKSDLVGKKILLCGFGVGLSWGTALLSYE